MTAYTGLLTPVSVIRNSISAITQILAGRNIAVYQRGLVACVSYSEATGEPVSVTLPYLPDDASDDLILAVQGFLDHEVGHLLFTDNKAVLEIGHDADWLHMQNVLEDPFVEKNMQKTFPGSKATITRLHTFFIDRIVNANYQKLLDRGSVNPLEYFGVLLPCISRAWHQFVTFDEYMKDKWHHVEPIIKKLPADISERVCAATSTSDNIALARFLIDAIMRVPDDDEHDDTGMADSESSEPGSEPSGKSSPGRGKSPKRDVLIDEEGDYEEPEHEPSADDMDDLGEPADEVPDDEESAPSSGPVSADIPGDGAGEIDGSDDDEAAADLEGDDPVETDEDDSEEDATLGSDEFDDEVDEAAKGEGSDEELDSDAKMSSAGRESDDVDEVSLSGKGGPKKAKGEDPEEEPETEEDKEPVWTPGEGESLMDYSVGDMETALEGSIASMASDAAKKSSYVIYSTDNDTIEPFKVHSMSALAAKALPKIESLTKHQVGVMQNSLQRALVSKNKSHWRTAQESGRINTAALSRLFVGDTRVFRRKVEHRSKSFDVSLLIDCSGSMAHGTGSLTRFQTAMVAAYAMADTLHRIGVNFEILGFTTKSHTSEWSESCYREMHKHGVKFGRIDWLYMPIFKSFEERWGPKAMERIGAAFSTDNFLRENVDGECVQIAAQRLIAQRSEGKMLIVLSDGVPACHTYDHSSLSRHLSKSVKSAEKAGIKVIGVGIDTDSVSRFYDDHIVLRDVTKLPTELVEQVQRVLLR
ncbi:cobaltochelatase CobT-related protein [Aeromonas sp. Y311-2]|uniref:cobaltochelatase CobT-related protein n=1 Tax=Aeromonas sp. Y311-2 TaxID=2990507 RepID=UPI0022E3B4C6|nr:hypothetical protein [Aeromonas sp. Y311-2]